MVLGHVARFISHGDIYGEYHRLFHHRHLFRPVGEGARDDTGRKRIAHNGLLRRFHHILVVCRRYVGAGQQGRLGYIRPLSGGERNHSRIARVGRPRCIRPKKAAYAKVFLLANFAAKTLCSI